MPRAVDCYIVVVKCIRLVLTLELYRSIVLLLFGLAINSKQHLSLPL